MVLERATGRTVSAYLSERLWGSLGMDDLWAQGNLLPELARRL